MQQHPTPPELTEAEQSVLRQLAHFHAAGIRYVSPDDVARAARLSYAATIGAVRVLALSHGYVTPRGHGHLWADGISLTTLGEPAAAALPATLDAPACCEEA